MMRTASASDLLDAVSSLEIEEGSSQSRLPSTTEKRKHAEIRDGSRQSLPLPPATEKRDRVENVEQPLDYFLPWGSGELCKCKGEAERERCKCYDKEEAEREKMILDRLPKDVQERYLKIKESVWSHRISSGYESHYANTSAEQIGDLGDLFVDSKQKQNGKIDVADGYTRVCSNPFTPLDFREDSDLYQQLKCFGKRVVAHFSSLLKRTVCFGDIASVNSCHSSCNHNLVTIKVIDPTDKFSEIIVRGRVYDSFAEAKVNHFAILKAH